MNHAAVFRSFTEATTNALRVLRAHLDFDTWFVARRADPDWVVAGAEGRRFGLRRGDALNWHRCVAPCKNTLNVKDPVHGVDGAKPAPTVRTLLALPMKGRDDAVLGALCGVATAEPAPIPEACMDMLQLIATMLGQLLQNDIDRQALALTNERFRYEAMTDALTRLPNRRAWEVKLGQEQDRLADIGKPVFVSIIDLDSLKEVNDREGHAAGDRLLEEAGRVLRDAVRGGDFVARLGGDEFAVLGLQAGDADTNAISRRFRGALARSGIPASVGTALAHSSSCLTGVWAEADRAMYSEKRSRSVPIRAAV